MPTQDLPSAINLVRVPDIWPPLETDKPTELTTYRAIQTGPDRSAGTHLDGSAGALNAGQAVQPKPPAADPAPPWPRQFAVLLAEGLAGVRPLRQVQPWMSEQGSAHLHRLLPLFADGHRPRLRRVITAQPTKDVVEMTMIVAFGPRTRALAVRLEQTAHRQSTRWRCTAIEAA
jgi:Family of unknown function (DUF6459)